MNAFDLRAIGLGLPVSDVLHDVADACSQHHAAVVQAPPGTGKTTLVPPMLANQVEGTVLVVAPRRVAVRAAAKRLATLDGSRIGDRVGFRIRGESHPGSQVEFLTPGVLLRRLLNDPELEGVGAVVLDEVHERHLETDLALGMLIELSELREDLVLVAMSATLQAATLGRLMGAPIIQAHAPIHDLEIRYQATKHPRSSVSREYLAEVAEVTAQAALSTQHSVLVFVPGKREVNILSEFLEQRTTVPVFPLHGQLRGIEQDAALCHEAQRIVVATSIAESSITVPGVRTVIDTGLSRLPKRNTARGITGLVTLSTSQASAEQRAGRAGREGPGTVIRCFSQQDFFRFAPHTTPEINSADLTPALLTLACWGTTDLATFPFLSPPPTRAVEDVRAALCRLEALSESGAATEHGHALAALPLAPRLAHALLVCGKNAADTIAAISLEARGDISRLHSNADINKESKRLRALAPPSTHQHSAGEIIARAFPERIARASTGSSGEFLLASGTRARLDTIESLSGCRWIAVAGLRLTVKGEALISSAAPLQQSIAEQIVGVEERTTASVEDGRIKATHVRRLGAIVLSSTPTSVDTKEAQAALSEHVREHGLDLFQFEPAAESLRKRLKFLHLNVGKPWPDPALLPAELFEPEIAQLAQGVPPAKIPMLPALKRALPWPEAADMDELAPAALRLPSGRDAVIDYQDRPVVAVKLQECFGLTDSPTLCGHAVVFHLLSPAGRPLAVTDDLASFWAGPYQGVRSDMRGRYPKHPWPEDPLQAQATAKTKRAMQS
ncbi:ATP-dependent RNA helicase [Corynebacterium gerontici]|uniref:ATP-dependent RNA helicase HrpB n=1 Tax=Corynebacterium gerontici TaxID=2079234 RepID=A0A3G6IXA1_9CORY|nr:ATP-dependent RNA helicase [Corynebacterium gerontici]AZA10401.1 ATP-dependent RNA helicase HrpB [Corynebacterium gerontici]